MVLVICLFIRFFCSSMKWYSSVWMKVFGSFSCSWGRWFGWLVVCLVMVDLRLLIIECFFIVIRVLVVVMVILRVFVFRGFRVCMFSIVVEMFCSVRIFVVRRYSISVWELLFFSRE